VVLLNLPEDMQENAARAILDFADESEIDAYSRRP